MIPPTSREQQTVRLSSGLRYTLDPEGNATYPYAWVNGDDGLVGGFSLIDVLRNCRTFADVDLVRSLSAPERPEGEQPFDLNVNEQEARLIRSGKKIEAVKQFRLRNACGLPLAYDTINAFAASLSSPSPDAAINSETPSEETT